MQCEFKIDLSLKEVFVLSALLGYECVVGVTDVHKNLSMEEIRKTARRIVKKFEKRKLIRYSLDGVLYINPDLRQIVELLCDAELVLLLSGNGKNGKSETSYYLFKEENTLLLKQNHATDLCELMFVSGVAVPELFAKVANRSNKLDEKLLLEEAMQIKHKIMNFQIEQAEQMLGACVSEEAVHPLQKILSGTAMYISAQIYRKRDDIYRYEYGSVVARERDNLIQITLNEYDMLRFHGFSKDELWHEVELQLAGIGKEQVDGNDYYNRHG